MALALPALGQAERFAVFVVQLFAEAARSLRCGAQSLRRICGFPG